MTSTTGSEMPKSRRIDELEIALAETQDALLAKEELFRIFNRFAVDIMAIDNVQELLSLAVHQWSLASVPRRADIPESSLY